MKIDSYSFPKSSFLSVEKDLNIIIDYILKNDRLKKLLYYTSKDALNREKLTDQQSAELIEKNIKIIPKLYIDDSVLVYLIIGFDNFSQNNENPEFKDNIIEFDIICNFNQWQLEGIQLRPMKIAAEIDSMFNGKKLSGLGTLEFLGANEMVLTDQYAGLCLMYQAIHGNEDKLDAMNPKEQVDIKENFDKIFNIK